MNAGSFIHKVLENAMSEKITIKEKLYKIRDQMAKESQWKGINIKAAIEALDVFWERNRNTIANNLMVEQRFNVSLGGFNFKGFIDRVDKIPGTQDGWRLSITRRENMNPVLRSVQNSFCSMPAVLKISILN